MDAVTRRVLKIDYEAETASFRYPHFLIGRQPTFRFPPPSAIYGHIASALGEPFAPQAIRFAYAFSHSGTFVDVETSHKTTLASRSPQAGKKYGFTPNVEIQTEPLERELLFRPRLTLYVDAEEQLRAQIAEACAAPHYPVLLGRSQDLGWYRKIQSVALEQRPVGYFDHTILPHFYSGATRAGILVLMPRFVDPVTRRATWGQYLQYEARGPVIRQDDARTPTGVVAHAKTFDVDPTETHPNFEGQRILVWHAFVDD